MDMNQIYGPTDEKPLDRLVTDGGFVGIFRHIGCVGDSLSSGEFECFKDGKNHYLDMFDYSWGQYIARMAGTKVENFSRGGMTAKEYCRSFAESKGFWDPALACDAYIIALGVNDILNCRWPVGSVDDIDPEDYHNNKDTFVGWYAQIIQRLKEIQPKARFFLVTVPYESVVDERIAAAKQSQVDAIYTLAKFFPFCYVVDLMKYGPDYSAPGFRDNFCLSGHMNPAGYLFTAKLISSYIDYIIRHDFPAFKQTGFIGTEYYLDELDKPKDAQ